MAKNVAETKVKKKKKPPTKDYFRLVLRPEDLAYTAGHKYQHYIEHRRPFANVLK